MGTPSTILKQYDGENSILSNLTSKMEQVLNQNQVQNHILIHESTTQIGIKMDGSNYAVWS